MATDYGTDIQAIADLPDPELLCSGETNRACAIARRLLTPYGALEEIGEEAEYRSIDLRDCLGRRYTADELRALEAEVEAVIADDPTVVSARVTLSFGANTLTVAVAAEGAEGPFDLVLSIDDVNATVLRS